MRGSSGFLRWMSLTCIVMLCLTSVNSGPMNRRSTRMIREIYSDIESTYQNDTKSLVTCLMEGAHILKQTITCENKPGCRAIQKTGECCPDYQCECEKNGKVYANGEKLVDPETPCTVCYCQGGEISCNPVTCYIRNDCEPKYINGRCCPEYDNCPPLERVKHKQESNEENGPQKTTTTQPTTTTTTTNSPNKNNPLGIKIKETTKVEEIRITDQKPQNTYPKIKISEVTTKQPLKPIIKETNQKNDDINETTSMTENNKIDLTTNSQTKSEETNNLVNHDVSLNPDSNEGTKIVRHTDGTTQSNEEEDVSSVSELEMGTSEEDLNVSSTTDNYSTPTITEVKNQPLPEVHHIGNRVVIVNQNSPPQSITVIGVEGLERGRDNEEVQEEMDVQTTSEKNIPEEKRSYDDANEQVLTTQEPLIPSSTSSELDVEIETSTQSFKNQTSLEEENLISDGFEEGRTLTITEIPVSSENQTNEIEITNSTQKPDHNIVYDTQFYSQDDESGSTPDSTFLVINSKEDHFASSSDQTYHYISTSAVSDEMIPVEASGEPSTTQNSMDDTGSSGDDELPPNDLISPGHPSEIEDDVSIYSREFIKDAEANRESNKNQNMNDEVDEVPKVTKVTDDFNSSSPIETIESKLDFSNFNESEVYSTEYYSNSSSEELLQLTTNFSSIEDEKLEGRFAPGEPLLIPEWERNVTTTDNPELEEDYSGSGSGDGFYGESSTILTENFPQIEDVDKVVSLKLEDNGSGSGDDSIPQSESVKQY